MIEPTNVMMNSLGNGKRSEKWAPKSPKNRLRQEISGYSYRRRNLSVKNRNVHVYLTYVKKSSEAGGVLGPTTDAASGCVLASLDVKLPAIANTCESKPGMELN